RGQTFAVHLQADILRRRPFQKLPSRLRPIFAISGIILKRTFNWWPTTSRGRSAGGYRGTGGKAGWVALGLAIGVGDSWKPAHVSHRIRCDTICDVRLVLDTDVVVAAMRSPRGGSAELLRRIRLGQAALLLNVPLAL